MLINFVQTLIRLVKSDDSYEFKVKITSKDLLIILMGKGICIIRGLLYTLLHLKKTKVFFLGSNTEIKHGSNLTFQSPLTVGRNVTIDCLSLNGIQLGNNVTIPDGTFIRCTGVISELGTGLKIGNNTGLGHNTFINAQGGIEIGNDVIVGPNVNILSENHLFDDKEKLIRLQGTSRKGIEIGNNVWLGANVTVLDGVKIGSGSVVGAGSVVTSSIPDNSVAVGVPCKVIKQR
jgi:acetyltransferase-like isoleucine patch superfamily enzyme